MEFTHYYGKHRRDNISVAHFFVLQKTKDLHVRVDGELEKDLEELADELKQDKSKVARDILTDFFLEKHKKEWEKEVKDW